MAAQIQAKPLTGPPFPVRAIPVNDRALPHNGRDAVKISSPDGPVRTLVVRGQPRSVNAKQGKADECHHPS
jgi:hypothetical protein